MLWSIAAICAILAGLIVFFVVLALLIAALGAGTAVAILVLPFVAFVKGLEKRIIGMQVNHFRYFGLLAE